jgi:hypothetical protein
LHGEGANAAGGAYDQHTLPTLDFASVSQTVKGRKAGGGHRSRLLERETSRFERDLACRCADIFGASGVRGAEDLVTGLEFGHAFAYRLHNTGKVEARYAMPWSEQSTFGTHQEGHAAYSEAIADMQSGRTNAD